MIAGAHGQASCGAIDPQPYPFNELPIASAAVPVCCHLGWRLRRASFATPAMAFGQLSPRSLQFPVLRPQLLHLRVCWVRLFSPLTGGVYGAARSRISLSTSTGAVAQNSGQYLGHCFEHRQVLQASVVMEPFVDLRAELSNLTNCLTCRASFRTEPVPSQSTCRSDPGSMLWLLGCMRARLGPGCGIYCPILLPAVAAIQS